MYSTDRANNKGSFYSLEWEQSHLRGGSCCISHFRQLFSGPQHKRSQMYFLTTEVRQARYQRPSSSCLRERQSSSAKLTDGWTESPNLPPALIHRMLLRDKIEHSSIINRLTVTLCHNNNPVTQGRDEAKSSSTPHYCDVDDGLMLARSARVYRQVWLKGARCAISWEEMRAWRDLTFTDPSRLANAVLGYQAHANVDKLRRSRLSWSNHEKHQILFEDIYRQKFKGQPLSCTKSLNSTWNDIHWPLYLLLNMMYFFNLIKEKCRAGHIFICREECVFIFKWTNHLLGFRILICREDFYLFHFN